MLNKLSRLSVKVEGRYATEDELQFVYDYLSSVDSRISFYEKIRDAEPEIVDTTISKMRAENDKIFSKDSVNIDGICIRDMKIILKAMTTAILIDDLERLKDGLLLWHLTIMRAMNVKNISNLVYQNMIAIVKEHLSSSEEKFVAPALQASQTIITN